MLTWSPIFNSPMFVRANVVGMNATENSSAATDAIVSETPLMATEPLGMM